MIWIGFGIGTALGILLHWIYGKYAVVKKGPAEQIFIDIKVNSEDALRKLDDVQRRAEKIQKTLKRL